MSQAIYFSREGHVGRVMLDRPAALNALSLPMIKAFYKQLMAWNKDPSVHAILLEAKHCRAFCAGGDVRFIYEQHQKHDPNAPTSSRAQRGISNSQEEIPRCARDDVGADSVILDFFWHEYRLNALIASLKKPYIALMNGITMGGGVGIGLHGSHPVATEKFIFAMPETAIGLFPDVGASYLLSRLPSSLGTYLALTGSRLTASDALKVGLVNHVIPESSMPDLIRNLLASDLSQNAGVVVSRCLDAVRVLPVLLPSMDDALEQRIHQCFAHQTVEEIMLALKACDDVWARETEAQLLQCSPLSLKVTLMQLQKAKSLDVFECLQMDEVLVKHFMQGHDFFEGVRARLIDKDKTPHWQPATLDAVTIERVAAQFVSFM
ncbi:MAG: enoyl-CoA hydratase/isomerase family protein [Gammaproteobacteria bacterium]|nr:enoyl-CoA hydratase/isomerase family protein [Gammaproteobacteria bacterium]